MTSPKVSVIVPVYNVEKYIHRCMNTLLNQTLHDIEIILVDDGSPDKCPQICDEYAKKDSRVSVIHKQNGGLGFARNSGMEIARGEYVGFVDSDDYVAENMFEVLYEHACRLNVDAVLSGFIRVYEDGTKKAVCEVDSISEFRSQQELQELVKGMIGAPSSRQQQFAYEMSVWRGIYSTEVIRNNNIAFHSEREYISEDIIFQLDYFDHASSAAFLPDTFYYYCYNMGSLTKRFRGDHFIRNKALYLGIVERLKKYEYDREAFEFAERLFLFRTCSSIRQIARVKDVMSDADKQELVSRILSDDVLRGILTDYLRLKIPLKRRAMYILMILRSKKLLLKLMG